MTTVAISKLSQQSPFPLSLHRYTDDTPPQSSTEKKRKKDKTTHSSNKNKNQPENKSVKMPEFLT